MIYLKNVTLWSCVWSDDPVLLDRTIKVLCHCNSLCNFGQTILFSSVDPHCDCNGWRVIPVSGITKQTWSEWINHQAPQFFKTDYAMSVHEDGFITNPELWNPEFLNYDYIGAPWPDHVVGNGGFNIESRKLLQVKMSLPKNNDPSDVFLCRTHRKQLEKQGITFAPESLAEQFSTEQTGHSKQSFGFHGRTFPKYKEAWKYLDNIEAPIHLTGHRMEGKICVTTAFDRNYMLGGKTLFKSIRNHTDCTGVDFKVITADQKVVEEFGANNCHVVTDEIKARYFNVKYCKELPKERYHTSWYRYEIFNLVEYDRVICIDSDCICLEDMSYLFSDELNRYDLVSVEDHIVSKCFANNIRSFEGMGLNLTGLKKRLRNSQVDVQPALLLANRRVVNHDWYSKLIYYANTTGFTYSIDEGILNDFVYNNGWKIKLLPLEYDYQDLYVTHCPELIVPVRPVIVHCEESKPFRKSRDEVNPHNRQWHDKWWREHNQSTK